MLLDIFFNINIMPMDIHKNILSIYIKLLYDFLHNG